MLPFSGVTRVSLIEAKEHLVLALSACGAARELSHALAAFRLAQELRNLLLEMAQRSRLLANGVLAFLKPVEEPPHF